MIFKQGNYPDVYLGASKLTIAADGCYTCVLAEINNLFGANCTPPEVAAHVEFYTSAGMILNTILATDKGLKNTVFDWSDNFAPNELPTEKMDEYLADWRNKQMAVRVLLPRGTTHFMKVNHKNFLGRYMCDDPYSGGVVDINHYGPATGIRYFSKRVPALP